jgi:hypothetical protein
MRLNSVCNASPPHSTSLLHTAATILIIPCFKYRAAPSHRLSIRGSTHLHAFSTVKHTLPIPSIPYRTIYHTLFKPFTVQAPYSTHSPIPSNSIYTVLQHTFGGFIKGILRGVRCNKSLRELFLHRRPPSWTTLVLLKSSIHL